MVFRRGTRSAFYVYLPTRTEWVQRSTGLSDRRTALAIERMLNELGPHRKRAWDLLDAVLEGTPTLSELYDAWSAEDLDGLRSRRADVNLAEHIAGWQAWLSDRANADTAQHYLTQPRTLIPEGRP